MSPAQKVEQVLAEHVAHVADNSRLGRFVTCDCSEYEQWRGWAVADAGHRTHVAEQIVAALGELEVEYGVRWNDDQPIDVPFDPRESNKEVVHRMGGAVVSRTVLVGEWQEVRDE